MNNQKALLALLFLTILLFVQLNMNISGSLIPQTALPAAIQHKTAPMMTLENFVLAVSNGDSEAVVGVFVPGTLALPISQQPKDDAGYVTRERDTATQFDMPKKYGTIGILAHNYLAGEQFFSLQQNQYAIIVYGDGRLEYYIIREVQKYQALTPNSTHSDFINLDNTNEKLTASQLFKRVYGAKDQLVFQTCIDAEGNASWGRIFIIAQPATNQVSSVLQETSLMLRFASFGLATQ